MNKQLTLQSRGTYYKLFITVITTAVIGVNILEYFDIKHVEYGALIIIAFFLINYFYKKTIIEVRNGKISFEIARMFPLKNRIYSHNLNNISAINISLSSETPFNLKSIKMIGKGKDKDKGTFNIDVNSKILIRLTAFLNKEYLIKTTLTD